MCVVGEVGILADVAEDPLRLRVLRLVDEALQTFDSPGETTAALVRKAQRIALLRRDYGQQIGLMLQATDVAAAYENKGRASDLPTIAKAREQLATLVGADEAQREVERQFEALFRTRVAEKGGIVALSVSQIEDTLNALQRAYDDAEPTPGMTPIDTGLAALRAADTRGELFPALQRNRAILGKIRQEVHDYLVAVEADLHAGKGTSDIFRRAQLYINESLRRIAPDALDKFVASQESLSSGTKEDFAHALTSCRRLIKSLADAVCPATNEEVEGVDGVKRQMTDDRYKNRLTEYVRTHVEGKRQRQTVAQIVGDLYGRLDALDGLASKGVHDEVTQAEAETCVVWTYMLAGDIVRIADGTSALLVEADR